MFVGSLHSLEYLSGVYMYELIYWILTFNYKNIKIFLCLRYAQCYWALKIHTYFSHGEIYILQTTLLNTVSAIHLAKAQLFKA